MNIRNTEQEKDLRIPSNCLGFGRIHHFVRNRTYASGKWWPQDPLPIDPACKALGKEAGDAIQAEVFQIAACNFNCWYCFVPHKNLNGNGSLASWLTSDELVSLLIVEKNIPFIIDLSGGHPELTPEWVVWMMKALMNSGKEKDFYIWSDDNLSTDYLWQFLSTREIEIIKSYPNYGKVCCFKGFDAESFAFNTSRPGEYFENQFTLMKRYLQLRIDLYGYVTLTCPDVDSLGNRIKVFVDKLQKIHEYLPLRTIPLEIKAFNPVKPRLTALHIKALENQYLAVKYWKNEIESRFSSELIGNPITDIQISIV